MTLLSPEKPSSHSPDLFICPVLHQELVYAPLQQAVVLLPNSHGNPPTAAVIKTLQTLMAVPAAAPTSPTGPLTPPFLGILPTRGCNLACAYCGFFAPEQTEKMGLAAAATAVQWYIKQLQDVGRSAGEIHFFGGEPFCAPDVVEFVVYLAQKLAEERGITLAFEAATNGVYPADRARWIADHIDTLVLSFDGPEDIQNRHRAAANQKGSYAIVRRTAEIFSQHATHFCLRACVTSETVARMPEIAQWFCDNFRPDAVSFEPLQSSRYSEQAGLYPPDPWEFGRSFIAAAAILERYGIEPVYATASLDTLRVTFCPVGQDVVIVSPNGRLSACYLLPEEWQAKGLNFDIGQIHAQPGREVVIEPIAVERVRQQNVLNKPLCQTCFAKWHCAGGCHVNHPVGNNYDRLCIQNRIITFWRILQAIGATQLAERWVADPVAMQKTILQPNDCFAWEKL